MLRNKIGPVLTHKIVFIIALFFWKSFSFCRDNQIFEKKSKHSWPVLIFNTQKGNTWASLWLFTYISSIILILLLDTIYYVYVHVHVWSSLSVLADTWISFPCVAGGIFRPHKKWKSISMRCVSLQNTDLETEHVSKTAGDRQRQA